jgi:hypothetical protein
MDTPTFKTERRRMLEKLAAEINELNTLYTALTNLKGVRQPSHRDATTTQWVYLIQSRRWPDAIQWLYQNGLSELPPGHP